MCVQIAQESDDDNDNNDDNENGAEAKDETENVDDEDESVELSWKVVVSAEEGIKCQDQRQYVID